MTMYLGSNIVSPTRISDNTYNWLPPNAKYVQKAKDLTITLADTSYPSWTPSTTATTIYSAENSSQSTTINADLTQYDFFVLTRMHTKVAFNAGATLTNTTTDWTYASLKFYYSNPSIDTFSSGVYTNTASYNGNYYFLVYYNGSGVLSGTNSSYGPAYSTTDSSNYTGLGSSTVIAVTRPAFSARCQTTYFTTARAAEVDVNNTTIHYRVDVFKVARSTTLGKVRRFLTDMYNGVSWDL